MQEWGEEVEDGAVYGVTLLRVPVPSSPNPGDTSPSCAFVQYRTSKVRRLKAATPGVLVGHLLDPRCQEQEYGRIFLSTYRTFISTSELIELLFQRYDPPASTAVCLCDLFGGGLLRWSQVCVVNTELQPTTASGGRSYRQQGDEAVRSKGHETC